MKLKGTIAIGAALAAAIPSVALAAPGDPLAGFGENGVVRTSFEPDAQFAGAAGIARAGDGYVTAGTSLEPRPDDQFNGDRGIAIAKYTATGELDPSFSGDGKLAIPLDLAVLGVAIDADGNIVVGGFTPTPRTPAAVSVRPDGTINTDFSGDGVATLEVGPRAEVRTFERSPGGHLVFGGTVKRRDSDLFVGKLEPNGQPASGFSRDGVATVDFGTGEHGGFLAQTNRLWIVGQTGLRGVEVAIARLEPSGALDRSFSDDGKRLVDLSTRFADVTAAGEDRSGALISILGTPRRGPDRQELLRMNGDGSIDRGYGRKGFAQLGRDGFARRIPAVFAPALETDHRRRAVVAGLASEVNTDTMSDFGVARFTAAGKLDKSFGRNGRVTTDFGGGDEASSVLVEPGRIIAAGSSCLGCLGPDLEGSSDVILAGYEG